MINLQRKKGSKAYTARDVLPNYKPVEQSADSLFTKVLMYHEQFGGTDQRAKEEIDNG